MSPPASGRPEVHRVLALLRSPKALLFLVNFGFAKLTIYFAPLVIAAFAAPAVYGAVELTQSIGLLVAFFLLTAPLAGLNQRYLVEKERHYADIAALVTLAACLAPLAVGLAAWQSGASPVVLVVIFGVGTAAIHTVASSVSRMISRRNLASWLDGFSMLAAIAIVSSLWALRGDAQIASLIIGYVAIAAAGAAGSAVWLIASRRPGLLGRLWQVSHFGGWIVIAATIATWQSVCGRIFVGLLMPPELPAYGVAFRVAGLVLGLQQLGTTALFARLYAGRTRATDRLVALILAGVGLMSGVIALAGPLVARIGFSALDDRGRELFVQVLPLVTVQIFFWVGYAFLHMRINRARLARASIPSLAVVALGGSAVILLADRMFGSSLFVTCLLLALQTAAYFAASLWVLARRGLPHRWVGLVGAYGGAALFALALIRSA